MELNPDILEKSEEPIKFAIVGITGIFVNFIILYFANDVLELPDGLSLGIGIIFSVTSNYFLNRIWTFKSKEPAFFEYLKYIATNALGILIQYSVAFGTIKLSSREHVAIPVIGIDVNIIYIGSLLGILLGFASNFLFSKFFVFNKNEKI